MVSNRCIIVVKEAFNNQELKVNNIKLGEVDVTDYISPDVFSKLKTSLLNNGFELIEDNRTILVERIKNSVIEMVHHSEKSIKVNFSDYLSDNLNHNYTYLANLFSEVQGISIEQFVISHKIERIKELILYDELNITEIAYKMNYSSVAHLSGQFKKYTGLTPSYFRKLKMKRLEPIENIGVQIEV